LLRERRRVVHTLHGPWTEPSRRLYRLLAPRVHIAAISAAQRDDNPAIPYAGVVHNGIDLTQYPLCIDKDDFLVSIGRSTPDKGPAVAIEIARRAGLPLAMVVKREEPFERAYWDEVVAPRMNDEVEVYEGLSHERKVDLLCRARAMVFPIQWNEPFGLVMVEAMACGTPVVARPAGAAIEVVDDGVTGFLRQSVDELVDAVARVGECDPAACRGRVADSFILPAARASSATLRQIS
jgi:glycosyltransferase involved in cell wall biosynthesis